MNKMLIYLDLCCYNRPYDDQSMLSIYLETQAKLKIQQSVKDEELYLVWSAMLDFENNSNIDEVICNEIFSWRKRAAIIIHQTQGIIEKALYFQKYMVHNKDANHLACALAGNSSYFVTTDKGILKKGSLINEIKIINPVDFIRIMEESDED